MKDPHPAEAPVAWNITDVTGYDAFTTDPEIATHRREMGIFIVTPLYLHPDPEVAALREKVVRMGELLAFNVQRATDAEAAIGRASALANSWQTEGNKPAIDLGDAGFRAAQLRHAGLLRAALEGSKP